ncbi:MAG TPA: ATP synthase subunit I [Thermodesulfobacteriota bacterium]|nr:ATP synthase subunit I [Deltaproteobacteria bacterium]HNU70677.1 ATP synthase subunit I [Thermodesulfobacteriota bacterium]
MYELSASKKKLFSIARKTVYILIVLLLISLLYQSKQIFFGVMFGGVVSLLNLLLLVKIGQNVFSQEEPSKAPVIIGYLLTVVLLLGIIYVIITYHLVDPIAFVIGFSAFMAAIFLESVFPSPRSS